MYTGLPLMPAMTPVLASGPPSSLRENQVAVRADDVLEHADDVGLEFLDVRAVEDRVADADHAGTDVLTSICGGRAATGRATRSDSRATSRVNSEPASLHGV